jgi:hypothetical protein
MTRSSQMIEHYAGRNTDPGRELFSAVLAARSREAVCGILASGVVVMRRYLVVANQTLQAAELLDELRERISAGPCSFFVG